MSKQLLPPAEPLTRASALYRDLCDSIRTGGLSEGQRLPTEQALAERYGISRGSVRKCLGRLRTQGLVVQRQGSGTYVTPGLASAEATEATVWVRTPYDMLGAADEWSRGLGQALVEAASARHLSLVHTTYPGPASSSKIPAGTRGALVVVAGNNTVEEMIQGIPAGVPTVVINRPADLPHVSSVTVDRRVGVRDAVSCLLCCGHRRIGFLAHPDAPTDEYIEGYKEAFAERGMPFDPNMIVHLPRLMPGADIGELFAQCMPRLNNPTALLLPRLDHPSRVLDVLKSMGREVPQQLSLVIVGGMDATLNHVAPRLSGVVDPIQQLARTAVELLASGHIGSEAAHLSLVSQFVYRSSIRECTQP